MLAFLWLAFVVLSVMAFFAILFTGRYPRALFDFNVGVMRWSWRVVYYGYGALATDRYPPFTIAEVPDYPAHLDVAYPERLSRGLVLVKWWLLAIPHYVVVAIFIGGGAWASSKYGDSAWSWGWGAGGLVGLLVFIAAIVLLFSGRYPRPLYDFVLGMQRWALRVGAYAALMTDAYPPFRLDLGGSDPGSVPAPPVPPLPAGGAAAGALTPPPVPSGPRPPAAGGPGGGWTAGRIVSVVIGAVLLFAATGALFAGGGLLWADRTQREGGYLMSPTGTVSTTRYAVTSDSFRLEGAGLDWAVDNVLGTARLQARPTGATGELFIGVARSSDAARYLAGVGYRRIENFGPRWAGGPATAWTAIDFPGGAPAVPPAQAGIWVASASGTGTQHLTWRPSEGDWTVIVMRADGTAGVSAALRAGVTLPAAGWIAAAALAVGVVLLTVGGLLVGLAVGRAQRPPATLPPAPGGPPPAAGPSGTGSTPVLTGGRTG